VDCSSCTTSGVGDTVYRSGLCGSSKAGNLDGGGAKLIKMALPSAPNWRPRRRYGPFRPSRSAGWMKGPFDLGAMRLRRRRRFVRSPLLSRIARSRLM
jgi:hypothetical protein